MIPEENVKDLAEIGDEIKNALEIVPASRMDDVLKVALQRMPTAITCEEEAAAALPATARTSRAPRRTKSRLTHVSRALRAPGSLVQASVHCRRSGDRGSAAGAIANPGCPTICIVAVFNIVHRVSALAESPRKYGRYSAAISA